MLGNGKDSGMPHGVGRVDIVNDYKPRACEVCGCTEFVVREEYSLREWRIGKAPAGAPKILRMKRVVVTCFKCQVVDVEASDPAV
jgi:hypothetical protein